MITKEEAAEWELEKTGLLDKLLSFEITLVIASAEFVQYKEMEDYVERFENEINQMKEKIEQIKKPPSKRLITSLNNRVEMLFGFCNQKSIYENGKRIQEYEGVSAILKNMDEGNKILLRYYSESEKRKQQEKGKKQSFLLFAKSSENPEKEYINAAQSLNIELKNLLLRDKRTLKFEVIEALIQKYEKLDKESIILQEAKKAFIALKWGSEENQEQFPRKHS